MMKTKEKIDKKNKVAPSLGSFKQALAVRLNPEFLPLGAERSSEGPESCSSMMEFAQIKNASCSICGSHMENSHPKFKVQTGSPATPHTEARLSRIMKTKKK
jgi:hypothetical protein